MKHEPRSQAFFLPSVYCFGSSVIAQLAKPNPNPNSNSTRLRILIIAQVLFFAFVWAGGLAAESWIPWRASNDIEMQLMIVPRALFMVTRVCQIQLLAIWLALGTTRFERRFALWTCTTAVLLWIPVDNATGLNAIDLYTIFTVIPTITAFGLLRRWHWESCWVAPDSTPPPWQLSMRQIAIVITVIAVLFAAKQLLSSEPFYFDVHDLLTDAQVFLKLAYSVIFSTLSLVAFVWATLSPARSLLPTTGVFISYLILTLTFQTTTIDVVTLAFWIGYNIFEAVFDLATLLIVRSCGFRIQRKQRFSGARRIETQELAPTSPTQTEEPSNTSNGR